MASEGPKIAPHTLTHTGVIVQLHSKRVRTRNMDGQKQEGGGRGEEGGGREQMEGEENRTLDQRLRVSHHCVSVLSGNRRMCFPGTWRGGACRGRGLCGSGLQGEGPAGGGASCGVYWDVLHDEHQI